MVGWITGSGIYEQALKAARTTAAEGGDALAITTRMLARHAQEVRQNLDVAPPGPAGLVRLSPTDAVKEPAQSVYLYCIQIVATMKTIKQGGASIHQNYSWGWPN